MISRARMPHLAILLMSGVALRVLAQEPASPAPVLSAEEAAALEPAVDVAGEPSAPSRAPALSAEEAARLEPAVDVGAEPAPATPDRAPLAAASRPAAATGPRVMDSLDLGTTSITGNQELPKVLYIVPWKRSDLGDLIGRPVNTLLDEVLAPVDPDVFERQLGYYEALHEESGEE